MSAKRTKKMSDKLTAMTLAVDGSLKNSEILDLVAVYGYTNDSFVDGQERLLAARAAVEEQDYATSEQHIATKAVKDARKDAKKVYQKLAKICRAIFKNDPEQLTALELRGTTPAALAAFLRRGYTLFDNALIMIAGDDRLTKRGYDAAKLTTEREYIVALDQSNVAQETAKGVAQQATVDQNDRLAVMHDWYAQYIKIARVALQEKPQLLEKLGIAARTTLTKAQREARRRRRKGPRSRLG